MEMEYSFLDWNFLNNDSATIFIFWEKQRQEVEEA